MAGDRDAPDAELQEHARRELKEALGATGSEAIERLRVAVEAAEEARLDAEELESGWNVLRRLEAESLPLTFTDVPRAEMERLQAASSRDGAVEILMTCMQIALEDGFQAEILAEFHYHNFMFCQKQRWCAEKASTFLSLMRVLHTKAIVEEKLQESDARILLDDLIMKHSRQLPPFTLGAFSAEEAFLVADYARKTFFKHYKMHTFVYSHRQDFSIRVVDQRVVPRVFESADLHKEFEVDPLEVAELADLFASPEEAGAAPDDEAPPGACIPGGFATPGVPALAAAGVNRSRGVALAHSGTFSGTGGHGGGHGGAGGSLPIDSGRKAEVEAAIDAVLQAHLPSLDSRLAQLPG